MAALLFASGTCALVYQIAWLREMRLVFGASTAASAAVLAVFMGGLGLGGILIGRRVDRHPRPLVLYAQLELLIALAAAATPSLVWFVRQAYVGLGGSVTLGVGGATVVRLLLTALVLCLPTVLMGGTLPAAARAVESDDDPRRRRLGLLYGANTLGAVTGAFLATFVLLEALGTHRTLWAACLVNALVGIVARKRAREQTLRDGDAPAPTVPDAATAQAPAWFVLASAAIVGFAFLAMELVWYRMLGPLLGGSSFTFGLILAVALSGIGLGGAAYVFVRPTLVGFAATCVLEALCIAIPFALGDRLAFLAIALRSLESFGFAGLVAGWTVITAIVVLPAAFVAGIQFPLLIGLLGRGAHRVGDDVGRAYAWNTLGAIAGSLAGGFGLLPLLTATGTWQLVAAVLLTLGLAALLMAREGRRLPVLVPAAVTALLLVASTGPTAAWRHSPIGAGRVQLGRADANAQRAWANGRRAAIAWSADGVESSIAIDRGDGVAVLANGKSDSSARGDAGTTVMVGMIGAMLHPAPKTALVIGLGTGTTAGWLGIVPGIERVDVVELEPAVLEAARASAPVNHDVLGSPRVHVVLGDAREVLLASRARYDVISSEPSNPYRAGVASLFTVEAYRAAADRLAPGGIFLQWLQAYEVDAETVRTVYATLSAVFPHVETWTTRSGDMVLAASLEPIVWDVPTLRERLAREPHRSALASAWRATGLEGLLARYVAGPGLARAVADAESTRLNTDDRTLIEFAFARAVGRNDLFGIDEIRDVARRLGHTRPTLTNGAVDWDDVDDQRIAQLTAEGATPTSAEDMPRERRIRAAAQAAFLQGRWAPALAQWRTQAKAPAGPVETLVVAGGLADAGDEAALEQLDALHPAEADVVLALLRVRQQRLPEAADALARALGRYQTDPWPITAVMRRGLELVPDVGDRARFQTLLATPFSVSMLDGMRLHVARRLAGLGPQCVDVFLASEPNPAWSHEALLQRARCYEAHGHPLAARALDDLETHLRAEPLPFAEGLLPAS
jgi:spermidine synthase